MANNSTYPARQENCGGGGVLRNVPTIFEVWQAPLAHTLPTFLWPGAAFVVGGQVDQNPNGMLLVSGDGSDVK